MYVYSKILENEEIEPKHKLWLCALAVAINVHGPEVKQNVLRNVYGITSVRGVIARHDQLEAAGHLHVKRLRHPDGYSVNRYTITVPGALQ